MSTPQYSYDDNLSVAQNIATALYAIANELSRFVDNNSDQHGVALKQNDKRLAEISSKLQILNESVKTVGDFIEPEKHSIDIGPVIQKIASIAENLDEINKTLRYRYSGEEPY